jgi:nitroimidazol reductase NimA-like FMN-containing flavoprotein (pyridoxamine 5'-phosphate oxidase superfamily)
VSTFVAPADKRDRNGLVKLDRQQCFELLRGASLGRIALTDGALPVVLPVSYALLDDDVVFATSTGAKLRAATNRAVVAFEVDQVDERDGSGWSVCITGLAAEVTDPVSLERLSRLRIPTLVPRMGKRFVRVRSDMVSGRLLKG